MVTMQVFFTQNLAPTISFPYNTAEVRHINPKLSVLEINAKAAPFLESCNVNDSVSYGAITITTRPSVLGGFFKSGAITIELDKINS